MVHSEIKLNVDESDAKSVKSNELFVNVSNEYLTKINEKEGKTLDKNIGSIIFIETWFIE